jgi:hypothetical protein
MWTITAARAIAERLGRELAARGDPYAQFRIDVLPDREAPALRLTHPDLGETEVATADAGDLQASSLGAIEDVVERAAEPY